MGLRNFFKQLFGGDEQKAQAAEDKIKETSQKASEFVENVGNKVIEKSKPILDNLEKTTEDLGRNIIEGSKDFTEKASDFAEKTGEIIIKTSNEFWKEVQEGSESITEKMSEKGQQFSEKAATFTEEAGAKVKESAEKTWETIKEQADKLNKKIQGDPNEPFVPKEDPFKEYENRHEEKSHLDALKDAPGFESGSFFDKASKFAEGNYDAVKDPEKPKIIIDPKQNTQAEPEPWNASVHGFEDRDGDGDPIIDDAEVVEEE
jgi:gas vesicle protein